MMTEVKTSKLTTTLIVINLTFMIAGVLLSAISSSRAYSLSQINLIILSGVLVVILDIASMISSKRLGMVVTDIIHFITTLLTAAALCMMISGRVLLMGYVYFSDLEKGNPMAVSAMNIAVISWIVFLVAVVANVWVGFIKNK